MEEQNRRLLWQYMQENGFIKEEYHVLELLQSVPNSISLYLKDDSQFLLSEKVSPADLEYFHVKGAKGSLDAKEGIKIPEPIQDGLIPSISNFDTLVANCDFSTYQKTQLLTAISLYPMKNNYLGFVSECGDAKLREKIEYWFQLLELINVNSSNEHIFVHDTFHKEGKELYLIRKK